MSLDLNDLLRDWPHEPGQIKVRRILGSDGKEKIQLRIDLGVIQMETTGRPDGERPHGCDSLLSYHLAMAEDKETAHEKYVLTPEEVGELQQEGIQYYHRYISLFQLNDFQAVIRDTQRNIDLFNFVNKHASGEEFANSLEQFRPYVIMMNTRARASIELEHGDFSAAMRQIERGREKIIELFGTTGNPEAAERSPEVAFLDEWMEEIKARQPLTKLEKMQREMEAAIANEAYERAAELRDAIRAQLAKKKKKALNCAHAVRNNRRGKLFRMKFLPLLPPLLFLAACGKSGPSAGPPPVRDVPVQVETGGELDPVASPDAVRGGSFTTWCGDYPKSLNVWLDNNTFSEAVSGLMFEPLIDLHSTEDRPVGVLANKWEISPDKKTYTFHIDPAAKWSDGKPVTAGDVQFYYDVIMNPKNLTSMYRVDLSRFSRPEVIDDHTVRVTATEPHWKNFWVAGGLTAFPRQAWANTDFNNVNFEFPVVDGPYALGEVNMNHSIGLKRRGDWWGRVKKYNQYKFNFDYLVFKSMEDRTKALEFLKTGGFDAYGIYTARIWAQETQFRQVQKNWVVRQEVFNSEPKSFQGFAMNMRRPLFQDIHVRQALAYLLDRELMNEKLMFNQYFLLNSYFPDLYPNYVDPSVPVTPYDPDKARELLKQAGWQVGPDGILAKNGQKLDITILHYEGSDMRHLNIYLEDLKKVGIDAHVELVSEATWTKRIDNHEFDMVWAAWGDSRLRDPEPMWSSKVADDISTENWPGLKDADVDKLIEQQRTEMDLGKRNDIDRQIDQRLVALYPYVLMWQARSHRMLYWNRFGTPKYVFSKYGDERDIGEYWWFDPAKSAALDDAMKRDASLPALPAEVHYGQ